MSDRGGFRGHRGRGGHQGHRGGNRGGHGHHSGDRNNYQYGDRKDSGFKYVHPKKEVGPISLDFPDYKGEKLHEIPDEFVEFLTKSDGKFEEVGTCEADVGINVFMNPDLEGFDAILKHRFSDFNVNEIDLDGKIVKLTDLEVPKAVTKVNEEEESANEVIFPTYASLSDDVKPLFSPLVWTRLVQLAKKYLNPEKVPEKESVKIDVTEKSKEERTKIHNTVKSTFKHLVSQTEEGKDDQAGKKFIVVLYLTSTSDKRSRERNAWPTGRGKFLHFILHKIDGDTTAIFSQMKRILFPNSSRTECKFKIAGMKDRRARTSQYVSIPFVDAARIKHSICKVRNTKGAYAGNFCYKKTGLELGDLGGNHFSIALRNISPDSKETVIKALEGLKTKGFVNYFGLQRFGTQATVKTSDIGLALIKSDWEKAIELLLKPRPNEECKVARGRAFWWMYRDPEETLKIMDESCNHAALERFLLTGLKQSNKNDLVGAFDHMPKNSKLLYLHAYQSLIWNKAVSARLQLHGDKVVVGDLVLIPDKSGTSSFDALDKFSQIVEEDKDDLEEGAEENGGANQESKNGGAKKYELFDERIVTVTDENLTQYTINDVIMPIPGWRVKQPTNESLKSIYDKLLMSDGIDGFESFKHKIDLFSLPGAYRKIVVNPWNFSWRFSTYSDPNQDLILSDFDLLRNRDLRVPEDTEKDGPEFEAVIVEMSLPSSSYATMALREAMKRDTSKSAQTRLTDNYNVKFAVKRPADATVEGDDGGEPAPKVNKPDNNQKIEESG